MKLFFLLESFSDATGNQLSEALHYFNAMDHIVVHERENDCWIYRPSVLDDFVNGFAGIHARDRDTRGTQGGLKATNFAGHPSAR